MSAYKNLSIIWNKLCRKQKMGLGVSKKDSEDQRLQFPPDLSRLLSNGTIFPWCLHVGNESYMNSEIPNVGNIYRLFTILIITTLSSFTYRGRKSGKTNKKYPTARDSEREIWGDPSHCPHSYHFLLNESVLFPGSLTSCSCYWLTKKCLIIRKLHLQFQGAWWILRLEYTSRENIICI